MRFATADEILNRPMCSHVVVGGQPGSGKTWQARTLRDQGSTCFVSMEAGDRTLQGTVTAAAPNAMITMGVPSEVMEYPPFRGGIVDAVRTYDDVNALASIIGGVSPTAQPGAPMSRAHVEASREQYPELARAIEACTTIWVDSINEMVQLAWLSISMDPRCFSSKGHFDSFAAYRRLGDEIKRIFQNMMRRRDKNIVFSALFAHKPDSGWELNAPGNVVPREFPGWFDTIITLSPMVSLGESIAIDSQHFGAEVPRFRAFICHELNPWRAIAKDRTSRCNLLEPPDIGALLERMNQPH